MAVNEKIRIKIKGYEHATVDAAAAKIVEAAKRSGSQVSGPSRSRPIRRSSQSCVQLTSTRTAVSSSSVVHTSV